MNVYIRLLGFLSDIKKEIAGKTLLGLVISATYLVQAVLMAQIVNLVFGSQDKAELFSRLAAVVAAILIRSCLMMRNESYTKTMAQKIKGKIRSVVLEHMFRLGPGQMNDKRSGELTSLVLDGVEALEIMCHSHGVKMINDPAFAARCCPLYPLEGSALEEGNDTTLAWNHSRKIPLNQQLCMRALARRSLKM